MTPEELAEFEGAYRAAYEKLHRLYLHLCTVPGGYKIADMIEDDVRDRLSAEEEWEKSKVEESKR